MNNRKTAAAKKQQGERMEISNNDLARILGNIEAKVDVQMQALNRHENSLLRVEKALTERADGLDKRLREVELANPAELAKSIKSHSERLNILEQGSAKSGVIAGIGSSLGVAVIIEIIKRKMG
ncbi:hypothetical protein [Undibacterium sp.]|uniref:hypothetical protein n=1 Tax=Undibacterium sp. TaxID=1914977 RepID=UPI0025F8284A|nr:hypothetical protein [Undibacterium sp.]